MIKITLLIGRYEELSRTQYRLHCQALPVYFGLSDKNNFFVDIELKKHSLSPSAATLHNYNLHSQVLVHIYVVVQFENSVMLKGILRFQKEYSHCRVLHFMIIPFHHFRAVCNQIEYFSSTFRFVTTKPNIRLVAL